jgi:hypothetical protein
VRLKPASDKVEGVGGGSNAFLPEEKSSCVDKLDNISLRFRWSTWDSLGKNCGWKAAKSSALAFELPLVLGLDPPD